MYIRRESTIAIQVFKFFEYNRYFSTLSKNIFTTKPVNEKSQLDQDQLASAVNGPTSVPLRNFRLSSSNVYKRCRV